MLVDRRTHTHTHKQTNWSQYTAPYRGGVTIIHNKQDIYYTKRLCNVSKQEAVSRGNTPAKVNNGGAPSQCRKQILLFSRKHTTRECVSSYTRMALTLTPWPWYSTVTGRFWRCTCTPKMKFLGQGFQKLQPQQSRHTNTDATKRITTPHCGWNWIKCGNMQYINKAFIDISPSITTPLEVVGWRRANLPRIDIRPTTT